MNAKPAGRYRLLHVLGPDADRMSIARLADIANGLGREFAHRIVVGRDADIPTGFQPGLAVGFELEFPPLAGIPAPRRLMAIARAMADFDLILTYGCGALDAALAHTLFGEHLSLARLIHYEDGASVAGGKSGGFRATWARRIGLGKASGLVVTDERLEELALTVWQQPIGRVKHIADGIDTAHYGKSAQSDALPRMLKRPGELWTGCLTRFDAAERIPTLVRAFAELADNWQLVLLGDGPGRAAAEAEIDRLKLNHRVHIRPAPADPAKVLGLFDSYAMAGLAAIYPQPVLQAMASGRPVAGIGLGCASGLLAPENGEYAHGSGDEADLAQALVGLSFDASLRDAVGAANRTAAHARHERASMIASYRRLYASAIDGRAQPV